MRIIELTPENYMDHGFYCIKNPKNIGFTSKAKWYTNHYKNGHRIKIIEHVDTKQTGFIEYMPSEFAWKPINVKNALFIQCLFVHSKKDSGKGYASSLINNVEQEALLNGKESVVTISGTGSWIPDDNIFIKLGYKIVDRKGRFVLLSKELIENTNSKKFNDWELKQKKYRAWNLVVSYQCPYHAKAAADLVDYAATQGVILKLHVLNSAKEAQEGPSGFGTFALIKDGLLIEDHYVSVGRFKNILRDYK